MDDDPGIALYEEMFFGGPDLAEDEISRETQWRTQDKQLIRICDMADSHLLNTIRVLRGISPKGTTFKTNAERRRRWLNAMANEAYRRHLNIDPLMEKDFSSHE